MDGLHQDEFSEGVRMSPKLTSRRKKSRPIKFSQDFILTDSHEDFVDVEALSPATCSSPGNGPESFEGSPLSAETPSEDNPCDQDELSQASSSGMIYRKVTSIRDSTYLKGSNPKKVKLEESSSPEMVANQRTNQQEEQETTFSSLLHTFASQVTSRVEPTERHSPYKERSPAPDAIWPLQAASPSAHTNTKANSRSKCESRNESRQTTNPASSNPQHDVSFSGLLQNFVSCVNESPSKDSSLHPPSLISLLKKGQKSSNSVPFTVGSKHQFDESAYSATQQSPYGKDQSSFAGLLHSFASVVDKGGQGSQKEAGHPINKNYLHVNSSDGHQQKATKSLLDVLHDTISRRVLESASSPPPDTTKQTYDSCERYFMHEGRTQQTQSSSKQTEMTASRENLYISSTSILDRVIKSDPVDDLHPSGQQWSHIRNVLPPLDAEEDDASFAKQTYQLVGQETDENASSEENHHGLDSSITRQQITIKQEPIDEDTEYGQKSDGQDIQIRIKTEPLDYPVSSSWESTNQDVNSTLRERLLSRIESRESPQIMSTVSSSSAAPTVDTNYPGTSYHNDPPHKDGPSSTMLLRDEHEDKTQSPAGLVSHPRSSGELAHWRNRQNGSFADLLHNITSSMLEKDTPGEGNQGPEPEQQKIKQELPFSDEEEQLQSAHGYPTSILENMSSQTHHVQLGGKQGRKKENVPRCIARLLSEPSQSDGFREMQSSDGRGKRTQTARVMSYADSPSMSSSPCSSSEGAEQSTCNVVNILSRSPRSKPLHSLSPRSKHNALMKQRWKRGAKYGLKLKQGWPRRREDGHHKHNEKKSLQSSNPQYDSRGLSCTAQAQPADSDNTSFTDILQKLAQKCQEGSQESLGPRIASNSRSNPSPRTSISAQQSEQYLFGRQQQPSQDDMSIQSRRISDIASSANLRNLLTQQGSLTQFTHDADPTSGSPSTSVQCQDVSFSNLMQDMASTVTKKKGSTRSASFTSCEDLKSLDPPPPWVKSVSGNWLRFVMISPDENPRVTMSVAVNLWNSIHEVKIHCHHMEVPVNHWIFRRFGKRIHTKVSLLGVLQAICNGCSVCEGTTRADLVQMYRNKLASTSRWQAAAVLEDSFGSATVRSSQCELLVSGLRRSREKRCSKCSKFVDRKLKAVMYHMRKKLGLS